MTRHLQFLGLALCAGTVITAVNSAKALNGPSNIEIDGGPLGPLEISGGLDGYAYVQSGTADKSNPSASVAGKLNEGAELSDLMVQVKKTTGPIQFTLQIADFRALTLGVNRPREASITHYTMGAVRNAFITLPLPYGFKISAGQLPSLEGYESSFAWGNPTDMNTVLFYVTNSDSRGVSAEYTMGPVDATVTYGDGNDTGVFNFVQFLGTYNFNGNNNLNIYGGIALGTTGPQAYYYGNDTVGDGNELDVNSNIFGAWYSTQLGNLSLTPEVQYIYAKPQHRYAAVGADIPNFTSNTGVALFADYVFGTSPYSLGAWGEYAVSHGDTAANNWFIAPDAQLVGFSVAPTWQYKNLYGRVNAGYAHLLNGSHAGDGVTGAYGSDGHGKDQFTGTLETGVVF